MFDQVCCNGPYSEADAAAHIQEAASALAWMHALGLVHSDLKPENLMLSREDDNGVIKLVDFGCAHLNVESSNKNNSNLVASSGLQTSALDDNRIRSNHTPAYSPPEVLKQLRDKNHGKTTEGPIIEPSFDAWSLGVILYTMLVGIHPFDPDCDLTDEEMEERIIRGEKPPLRGSIHTEHLSEDAIALIEGLMNPDPTKRLTTSQLLRNRWVMGETASSTKIDGSDKRLAVYRRYKTKIGSTFFKALLAQTDSINRSNTSERVSLLESAFRLLDTKGEGLLKAGNLGGDDVEEVGFSYSDISSLLSDNMKNRYFEKGCVLYNVGDTGDCLYLIDSGTVEFTTADGFKKLLGSGELVGEELMKDASAKYSGTARCTTPVHALAISRELFEKYVQSDEDTLLSMAERYRYRRRERASMVLRMNGNDGGQGSQCATYPQNATIFEAGDPGTNLFLVEEGRVDISVSDQTVRQLKPNELTGEHAVLYSKPYNVTARCVSADGCKLQAMKAQVLHQLFEADPSLRQDFRELVLRRDFKKALCAKIGKPFPATTQQIREAFDTVDVDGKGAIELDGLRSVVQRFDPTYNERDIQDMLESLDLNGSGKLSWKEFHRIFAMDMES